MKKIFVFLPSLKWLDYLLISIFSVFSVTFNLFSVHYRPILKSEQLQYHYYGFPLPNAQCLPWANHLHKTIYILPFISNICFYFAVYILVYWFFMRYAFRIKLKKRYFLPLIFGMLFMILTPMIIPDQESTWLGSYFNKENYTISFNWFGFSK